ncbi:hypothetical protein QLX08_004202 [Tetragonisca angustula]|uniref:Uncharacterized protein n=1 Tax=Tetragonisca angustula TaxID=166442 RepID=A0AAW1A6G5_9HYME
MSLVRLQNGTTSSLPSSSDLEHVAISQRESKDKASRRSRKTKSVDDDHEPELNSVDVLYVEYEEDEEEERKKIAQRQRAKSPDAPRRVLSLVERWREWQVISKSAQFALTSTAYAT